MAMLRSRGARPLTTVAEADHADVTLSRPAIMRSSVVLPQPEGPSRVTNLRLGKRRSTSLRT